MPLFNLFGENNLPLFNKKQKWQNKCGIWKLHNLSSTHLKIMNKLTKCSVNNDLASYVIWDNFRFNFGAVY